MDRGSYFYRVGKAFSCLINALIGGDPEEPISLILGRSIMDEGWASKVPWPGPIEDHFLRVYWRSLQ